MREFSIYTSVGQIIKTISAPEDMLECQLNEGEFLLLGAYDDSTYYVDTTGLHVAVPMPLQPSEYHTFDFTIKDWVDLRSLDHLRLFQWEKIKKKRDELEFGPFEYNGMIFDGDENAQRRLNGYISISKSAIASVTQFSANFVLANNNVVLLTAQDFVNIEIAKISAVAAAFDTAIELRKAINNATTKEAILVVDWP